MKKTIEYHVEINGEAEQIVGVPTSEYALAALASLAILEHNERRVAGREYDVVKIWIPEQVAGGYGPHFYVWDGDRFSSVVPRERQW